MNKLNGLTRRQLIKAIELLQQASGVQLYAAMYPSGSGRNLVRLSPDEMADYVTDPLNFSAEYWGITPEDLLDWSNAHGHVACPETSSSGKFPCGRSGPPIEDPRDWPNRKPRLCYHHQELADKAARRSGGRS
ncbi:MULTISPECIES: hypothetical protein [Rhodomicrobium]|uniref:hypothetical protein n=1 Tax=Rhodomicrobium TaxID=1068 RepID=UPI000B4AF762|nr:MULTISPECIES: hypothetical protein [Rhodomicrobium]